MTYAEILARHRDGVAQKERLWARYEIALASAQRASAAERRAYARRTAAYDAWDAYCRQREAEDAAIIAEMERSEGRDGTETPLEVTRG